MLCTKEGVLPIVTMDYGSFIIRQIAVDFEKTTVWTFIIRAQIDLIKIKEIGRCRFLVNALPAETTRIQFKLLQ